MPDRAIIPGPEEQTPSLGQAVRVVWPVATGVVLGAKLGPAWLWLGLSLLGVVGIAWRGRRPRLPGPKRTSPGWWLLMIVALVAAYTALRLHHLPADRVEPLLQEDGQLAEVTGVVLTPPSLRTPDAGFFADFSYERPATLWTLRLETLTQPDGKPAPLSGTVLVKVNEAVVNVEAGQRLRILGWLADIGPTKNPGEFGYRRWLRLRGVAGRLSVAAREHVTPTSEQPRVRLPSLRDWTAPAVDAARTALATGMEAEPQRLALLETLLLGRSSGSLDNLRETFRRVGLAHVLSISGAHLGILIGLVWLAARAVCGHPRRVAVVVLLFVLAYTALLPGRVPILRATIMAVAFFLPLALGRHVPAMRSLAAAAVLVLLWKPAELFSPGFQLSFVAVAAIMAYTRRVSEWVWPPPLVPVRNPGLAVLAGRFVVDYLSVSVVAFVAVLPLIVLHFGIVSPLAVLLSMLAWPVLGAVLALGYLKMLVGIALPSVGLLLSGPLAWAVDALINLARRADDWPGSSFALAQHVGVVWTLAALAFAFTLLSGGFARRRAALTAALVVMVGWAGIEQGALSRLWRTPPAMQLTMFAVGDGSCFLVQSGGQTLMFDCGSQGYTQVGRRSVVPALRRLGIDRIDVLVLSHADLDHFSGVPEVVEALPVGRVIGSPEVLADAWQRPDGAAAFLLDWLNEQELPVEPIAAGWTEAFGDAELSALWPPPGLEAERSNDHSLVLRITAAGRTALLNGDLQADGMTALLDPADPDPVDLDADIADLPHHGSFTEASSPWLDAVSPQIVLQSSGPDRLRFDRWKPLLTHRNITRFASDQAGMTTVTVTPAGEIHTETYLPR